MRISDWSSDVCSSDLGRCGHRHNHRDAFGVFAAVADYCYIIGDLSDRHQRCGGKAVIGRKQVASCFGIIPADGSSGGWCGCQSCGFATANGQVCRSRQCRWWCEMNLCTIYQNILACGQQCRETHPYPVKWYFCCEGDGNEIDGARHKNENRKRV